MRPLVLPSPTGRAKRDTANVSPIWYTYLRQGSKTGKGQKMRKMTEAELQAFAAVRARLLSGQGPNSKGYYADAAFRVRPVAAEALGTWAVDKAWRIYIDPAHLPGGEAGWTVEQCTDVFEHELGHLLREHDARMRLHAGATQNHEVSNIACDLEINDDLDPNGFVAKIGCTPNKMQLPENKTCEQYYDLLMEQQEQNKGQGDGQGDGQDKPQGGMNGKGCGSGGGGNPIEGELDPTDDSVADGVGEGEAKIARHGVAEAIQQHERQHGRGTVPGGLSEWANKVLAPATVPWQRVLQSAIRAGVKIVRGRTDYSYSRLSRRASSVQNVALPGTFSPTPSVGVILDTSGSMSLEMVTEALNEIEGISKQLSLDPSTLTLVQVDAAAGSIQPWKSARNLELTGRGGTDMRVGYQTYAEMKRSQRPNILVCLTDGYTPWPTEKPRGVMKAVIGIIGDSDGSMTERTRQEVPWATTVRIGE